jgi:hypothetical protein
MVCYNGQRPFSLDAKIADLDQYLPQHKTLLKRDYYPFARKKESHGCVPPAAIPLSNAFTTECRCRSQEQPGK